MKKVVPFITRTASAGLLLVLLAGIAVSQ